MRLLNTFSGYIGHEIWIRGDLLLGVNNGHWDSNPTKKIHIDTVALYSYQQNTGAKNILSSSTSLQTQLLIKSGVFWTTVRLDNLKLHFQAPACVNLVLLWKDK